MFPLQDLFDAVGNVRHVPRWLSSLLTCCFVASTVGTAMLVTDLGAVLHMIGGTVAAFMVFLLPGLLLMNAAIIKHTVTGGVPSVPSLDSVEVRVCLCDGLYCTAARHSGIAAARHSGTTAGRHSGTTAARHSGTTAAPRSGTTAARQRWLARNAHVPLSVRPYNRASAAAALIKVPAKPSIGSIEVAGVNTAER